MKRVLFLLFAAFIFTIPFFYSEEDKQVPSGDVSPQPQAAIEEKESGVAATVNGREIPMSEVNFYADVAVKLAKSGGREIGPESMKAAREEWVDRLITRQVLTQLAEKKGISVSYDEMKEGLALADMSNSAMPEEKLTEYVKGDLAINKLIEAEVLSKTIISDEEAQKYYEENPDEFKVAEQVRASHIMARVDGSAGDEEKAMARKLIGTILEEIKTKGTSFKAAAERHRGGLIEVKESDLGYFPRGKTAAAFEKAAFALKPGEMSGIVETNLGYHIIGVTDRKPARVIRLGEVMDRVKHFLRRRQTAQQVKDWVEKQKEAAEIVIMAGK